LAWKEAKEPGQTGNIYYDQRDLSAPRKKEAEGKAKVVERAKVFGHLKSK